MYSNISTYSKEMTEFIYTNPNKLKIKIQDIDRNFNHQNMGISIANENTKHISIGSSLSSSYPLFNNDLYEDVSNQLYKLNSVFVILSSVIYSLIFVLSIFGNTVILIVLLRRRRMRIVTNFFLANITVANLMYTIVAPFPFIVGLKDDKWVFFDFLCPILPFFSTMSIIVNTMTMIAASMERLIVIVYPFKCKLTKRKCSLIICSIWIFAILASLPWTLTLRVKNDIRYLENDLPAIYVNITDVTNDFETIYADMSEYYTNNSSELIFDSNIIQEAIKEHHFKQVSSPVCQPQSEDPDLIFHRVFFIFLCVVQYCLPLIVLCFTYTIIAYYGYVIQGKIDFSSGSPSENKCHNNSLGKNKNKLIKMLLLIIICFNICWMPLQLNALVYAIHPKITIKFSPTTYKYFWMCAHCLAFSHFCHNPFINGLLNKKFKSEIIILFKCGYSKSKQLFRNKCICSDKKSNYHNDFHNEKKMKNLNPNKKHNDLNSKPYNKNKHKNNLNNNYMLKNGHIYKLVVKLNHLENNETNRRMSIKNYDENRYQIDKTNKECLNRRASNSVKQIWNNKLIEPRNDITSNLKENNVFPNGSIKALKSKESPLINTIKINKSNSFSKSKSSSSFSHNKDKLLKQKSIQSTNGNRKKSTQSTATILINKFKLIKLKNRLQKSSSVKFNTVNNKNFNPSSYYLTRIKRNSVINQQVLINEIKYLKNSQNKQNQIYSTSIDAAKKSVTLKDPKFIKKRFSKKNYSTSVPFYKPSYTHNNTGNLLMYKWNRFNEDSVFYFHPEVNESRQTHFVLDSSDSSKNFDSNPFLFKAKESDFKKMNRNYHSNDLNENQPFINEGKKHLDLYYHPLGLNDQVLYNSSPNLNELTMPNVFKNKKKYKFDFDESNKYENKQDSNPTLNRQYSSQSIENLKFHNSL